MRSIYIGQLVRPAAAPLIMHMCICLEMWLSFTIVRTLHRGGLFETENGLLFYESFFITLHYSRMHCVQFYSTKDLNVVQNT